MELQTFFNELRECYKSQRSEFYWTWEEISNKNEDVEDFVYYIAFHLSKDILHGPLPDDLHSRMVFTKNKWAAKYIKYLSGGA